jgi:hypothetical protein
MEDHKGTIDHCRFQIVDLKSKTAKCGSGKIDNLKEN